MTPLKLLMTLFRHSPDIPSEKKAQIVKKFSDTQPPYSFKGPVKSLVDEDNPDLVRALVDEEQAFDTLAYAAGTENITPGQQRSALKQVYNAPQSWLKRAPDTLPVYRYGDLRGDEPVSFTLDPNFTGKSLPWLEQTGSKGLQSYTVNKKDILAAPNAVLRPGKGTKNEYEVIIPGSKVEQVSNKPPLAKLPKLGHDPFELVTEASGLSTSKEARNIRRIKEGYPSDLVPEYHGTDEKFDSFNPQLEIFTAKRPQEAQEYGENVLELLSRTPPKFETPTIKVYPKDADFRSPDAQFNPYWRKLKYFLASQSPLALLPWTGEN